MNPSSAPASGGPAAIAYNRPEASGKNSLRVTSVWGREVMPAMDLAGEGALAPRVVFNGAEHVVFWSMENGGVFAQHVRIDANDHTVSRSGETVRISDAMLDDVAMGPNGDTYGVVDEGWRYSLLRLDGNLNVIETTPFRAQVAEGEKVHIAGDVRTQPLIAYAGDVRRAARGAAHDRESHAAGATPQRALARRTGQAYHRSIMKTILAVLLLAMALSAAAAEPRKPDGFPAPVMCNGTYALCIKAPCEKQPDGNDLYPCRCVIETGWNMGPNSCEERQKNLTSTYANLFNLGSSTVSCPASTQWAWCYGAQCEVDPRDPTRAICKCPTSTKSTVILVAQSLCPDPSKVCGMLWSGATPGESRFANDYYYWWMTTNGQPSNLPAAACAAPPAN